MYGDQALDRIGRDMLLVREFELMLNSIKREGSYRRVLYPRRSRPPLYRAGGGGRRAGVHPGRRRQGLRQPPQPRGDRAKGLSAITSRDHDFLFDALSSWSDGAIWKVVEKRLADADFEQQAINYLLYGMTAETFGRRTGFNEGSAAACTRFATTGDLSE